MGNKPPEMANIELMGCPMGKTPGWAALVTGTVDGCVTGGWCGWLLVVGDTDGVVLYWVEAKDTKGAPLDGFLKLVDFATLAAVFADISVCICTSG